MTPQRATAAFHQLLGAGLPGETLIPAALELLHDIVPSDRNLFDWADEQGRLVHYYIEGPIDLRIAQLYFDVFHNRLEAEAMPAFASLCEAPLGVRGAGDLAHAGFFNSALYNEIWRPQGLHSRLEGVLRARNGRLLGSLVLYRGPRDPAFRAADSSALGALLPPLADALAAAAHAHPPAWSSADQEGAHLPGLEPDQSLLLDLDGRLLHHSPGAMRLLLLADGGVSRDALSRPIAAQANHLLGLLLARVREPVPSDAAGKGKATAPVQLQVTNGYGQFVARAELLQSVADQQAPLVQVTLRWLQARRLALDRMLRGLGLTSGQTAVCRELHAGASMEAIASLLGVATSTVVDHARKIYRALDVHSGGQLRALLDARLLSQCANVAGSDAHRASCLRTRPGPRSPCAGAGSWAAWSSGTTA